MHCSFIYTIHLGVLLAIIIDEVLKYSISLEKNSNFAELKKKTMRKNAELKKKNDF